MKKLFMFLLAGTLAASCTSQDGIDNAATENTLAELQKGFANPPQSARTQVWWHWMNGNITKEGIKHDIEWFDHIGLGGFHTFDAAMATPTVVDKRLIYMDEGWKDAFAYAMQLADEKGLEVTIASSPGWSATGGPWVEPKDAMKKLVWRELDIKGGQKFDGQLPEPFNTTGAFQNAATAGRGNNADNLKFYEDIAVVAVKMPESGKPLSDLGAKITSSGGNFSLSQLTNGDLQDAGQLPADQLKGYAWIQYEFPEAQTVRSVSLSARASGGFGGASPFALQVSDNGIDFRDVANLSAGNIGQRTTSIESTTDKFFRLKVNNPQGSPTGFGYGPIGPAPKYTPIAEFRLFTESRIHLAEDKAAFTSAAHLSQQPTPDSNESFARLEDVVDITKQMTANGHLSWEAPEGQWRIYRFGYSLTGKMNHPAPPEATGLEVDKMDPIAWRRYFDNYMKMYQEASAGRVGQNGVQYILTDSYEAEAETWTPAMFEEFKNRRGYDLHQWLPVLTGQILQSPKESDAFLRDWRMTIGDLIAANYDLLTEIMQKDYGMKGRYSESHEAGRVYVVDGMDVKRTAQVPMSAMWMSAPWLPKDKNGVDIRTMYEMDDHESGSAAHVFGQNVAAAESFTAAGSAYSYVPENLKPTADLMMWHGINRFVIHESAHQPLDDKVPGMSLSGIGQWFNRHDTWAEQAKVWVDYMSRSCFMLQQGHNVADVLVYYGEDANVTSQYQNAYPQVPAGYNYDFINPSGLRDVVNVKNGKLVTDSGTEFSVLYLDNNMDYVSLPVLRKIAQLAEQGALIVGQKAQHPYSLTDDQAEFDQLVAQIWENGRQNVTAEISLEEVLSQNGILPDVTYSTEGLRHLHRTLPQAEIYWVNKPSNDYQTVEVSFRTSARKPQIWHPETGKIEEASYRMENGRTIVKLDLVPDDAVFVVFGTRATENEVTLPAKSEQVLATVDGQWAVKFQAQRGAPAETIFDRLQSYTESSDFGIKYFSGTATYQNTLKVDDIDGQLILDLGEVKNLAEVIINGQSVGTLWKKPFRVNITDAVKAGDNQLEIKVVNTWINRLVGDKQPNCPEKVTFTDVSYYSADTPLQPSGLLGPVRLITEK